MKTLLPLDGTIPGDDKSNNCDGWYALGMQFFKQANIMPTSINAAAKWLLKAALNGHAGAALMLGRIMESRGEKHYSKAFRWYHKAAMLNNIEAMRRLSHAYDKGIGTGVNKHRAQYWSLRAEMRQAELDDISDSFLGLSA